MIFTISVPAKQGTSKRLALTRSDASLLDLTAGEEGICNEWNDGWGCQWAQCGTQFDMREWVICGFYDET